MDKKATPNVDNNIASFQFIVNREKGVVIFAEILERLTARDIQLIAAAIAGLDMGSFSEDVTAQLSEMALLSNSYATSVSNILKLVEKIHNTRDGLPVMLPSEVLK